MINTRSVTAESTPILIHMLKRYYFIFIFFLILAGSARGQEITTGTQPAQLDIRGVRDHCIRITLKPLSFKSGYPSTPAIVEDLDSTVSLSIRQIDKNITRKIGSLKVEVHPNPLTVVIYNNKGETIQQLVFETDGRLSFKLDGQPVLGMGEGGPKPARGVDWRMLPVQFDRSGALDSMQPRWQSDAYGSRNPVAMLVGTKGWGLFVVTPWVMVDTRLHDKGFFIPRPIKEGKDIPQTEGNQQLSLSKGLPPQDKVVPGLYDVFVFDGSDPQTMMKDLSVITGPAALPPRWAMGYMQSHRTLQDDQQMVGIVDRFREKKIPVDAVIYLGTGFTPRGWNKMQPSFEFNPEVFIREPKEVIKNMHDRHVKVIVHMVPWDRDVLPTLHGSIPPADHETLDAGHIQNYWKQHEPLLDAGVDGFWPDEGDWFNLFERVKRHQLYYQGHLSSNKDLRPWSLHRNGYPGIAQWGGWVWSGDTESSWKTLEAQIAVGLNYSLSVSPFWGSDIGGFYPNEELTGELYIRWHQFGAFCPSFRSHGRTWWTHLPWGWGLSELGPLEGNRHPLESELNNPSIEPIAKKYNELRYQLLPYNYTLAWQARNEGMPMMRPLWLHYPSDRQARAMGDEYLWGRDMLIAPVFNKGASTRDVYLPAGDWYDWWTIEKKEGSRMIGRSIDLSTMPIYVRAGAIIPIDPIRQYVAEVVGQPTTLRIFSGADGDYTLYEDDGTSQKYLQGEGTLVHMLWNDKIRKLTLEPGKGTHQGENVSRNFKVLIAPDGKSKTVKYEGHKVEVLMN